MVRYSVSMFTFALVTFALSLPLLATPPVPYRAQVVTDSTAYRAGPGNQFYSCGYLVRGEIVEVYQQDASGFLAIRPPQPASSWVLASDVELTEQTDIGRVLRSNVTSWIDSQLPAAPDDQWQVRLKEGELVEIIEKRPVPGEPLETALLYYRIAPPAGEFRWIPVQSVQPIDENVVLEQQDSIQLVQYTQEVTRLPADGWRDRRLANIVPQRAASANRISIRRTNQAMVPPRPLRQDPADSLQPLRNLKEVSVDQTRIRSERTEPRRQPSTEPAQRPTFRAAGVEYDGVGWLMPVYAKNRSMPPFALLNDEGKLIQYVTPAPGVNLRRYARKNVGVFGTRRLSADGEANHLTAYRIIDLARHR